MKKHIDSRRGCMGGDGAVDNNQKIDNELNLALNINKNELQKTPGLSAGYNPEKDTWEIIVKYNGDLTMVGDKYGAITEILTDQYAIMTIAADKMNDLARETQVEYIEKPKNMKVQLDDALYDACIENVQNFPQYSLRGKGVIIGIIDSGIDFSHPDFINEDGSTRILYIWDQTIQGRPPKGFVYGTEYDSKEINEALKGTSKDEIFKSLPSQDIVGHGTAVAGVAGGNGRGSNGRYIGAAPEAEFIIVKMGQKGFESFAKNTEIMRGLKYIIEKAEMEKKPVSINLSYGNNNGSHDGSSIFETYIDAWASYWKNTISVGSGNEGISGKHTSGYLGNGDQKDVEVFIQANESNISLQLWKAYEDDIEVELIAPSGQSTGFIKQLLGTQRFRLDFTDVLLYYGEPSPFSTAQQIYIELVPVENVLNNGKWTIRLKANKVVTGKYDIWLPVSFGTSRETMFAQPTTDTTLTLPSTALSVITVGAYNSKINSIAPFSGRGYTRTDNVVKPDLVAPGVGITAPKVGGGYSSFSGTSIATPFVTGSAALLMQYGIVQGNDPFLYGQKVKSYLISGARRDKANLNYPNNVWGYGTLCLQNSIDVINRSISFYRSQRHDPDEQGVEPPLTCEDKIVSEEYVDIIKSMAVHDEASYQELDDPACQQKLDRNYRTIFLAKGDKTCREVYKRLNFEVLPPVYCLAYDHGRPIGQERYERLSSILVDERLGLDGEGILVGVVDTGINYTHECFKDAKGATRIEYIWDQSGKGTSPSGFGYGAEYTKDEINRALGAPDPYGVVPQIDTNGHGTFVTGVIAGSQNVNRNFTGIVPKAQIAVVKVKEAKRCLLDYYLIDDKDEPAYQTNDVIMGMNYLKEKAKELKLPLILYFAGQTNMTPHNGESVLEEYLDESMEEKKLANIVVAGNEAQAQHHFRGYITQEKNQVDMDIQVLDKEPGFFVCIWSSGMNELSISVISPSGIESGEIPFRVNQKQELIFTENRSELLVEYSINDHEQATYLRLRNPTPGIWKIKVFGKVIKDDMFDAYLPVTPFLEVGTKFINADPAITVTDPGNASGVITAGGYNNISRGVYPPSGRGYSRSNVVKPDFTAPAVNILGPLLRGGYGVMSGTSVAGALVAGASGIIMEWGLRNKIDQVTNTIGVRNAIARGCSRDEEKKYPNNLWGYGKVNLMRTIGILEKEYGVKE